MLSERVSNGPRAEIVRSKYCSKQEQVVLFVLFMRRGWSCEMDGMGLGTGRSCLLCARAVLVSEKATNADTYLKKEQEVRQRDADHGRGRKANSSRN